MRKPGSLKGVTQFNIEKCNVSQIYVHDWVRQCNVDLCFNCSIVIGPVKKLVSLDICKDSKFVIFCNELKVRDCTDLEIMLYSPNPPIIENC